MSKKILVIDDETALRSVLSDKLNSVGFETLQARDGLEGLSLALSHHPDLILLDVVMPVEDGITFLKELRTDAWGLTAKVILLTNLSDEQKVAESLKLGVFDYLVKSDWKLDDLLLKINERLGMQV